MIILCLRTDNPLAEVALYEDEKLLEHVAWEAHRQLAETLHVKIQDLLSKHGADWKDIGGVVMYKGPGSFTGLRIGFSVGNAVAYANGVLVSAETGDDWQKKGVVALMAGKGEPAALPEYGGPAHTT